MQSEDPPRDPVIIISYAELEAGELAGFVPRLGLVDAHNRIARTGGRLSA